MSIETHAKRTLDGKELTVRYTGTKTDLIMCGLALASMFPDEGNMASGTLENMGRFWAGMKNNNEWEVEYYPLANDVLTTQDQADALRAFANRI